MSNYLIANTRSGVELGIFEGATEDEALDAMARDAGYPNYEACCEVAPSRAGEIVVREVQLENPMLGLIPAYGRDYRTMTDAVADFRAGKDFLIADVSSAWDGKPANIDDLRAAGHVRVQIRYAGLRKVALVDVVPK
jgi:hypothetical protein